MSAPLPPRDPGLQSERTALSWGRTALTVLVNALLVLRAGIVDRLPAAAAMGVVLVGLAALIALFGHLRSRELVRRRDERMAFRRVTTIFAVAVFATAASIFVIATT